MAARPLKLWPFLLVGLSSISIAKISLHPRLKFLKDSSGWTIRYDYLKDHDPGPADKGLEIAAPPRSRILEQQTATASSAAKLNNTRWILDTGANSHMCTNRDLMHSYSELTWGQTQRGFTGANGSLDHHVGIGDCTLTPLLPFNASGKQNQGKGQPVTLQRVHFYPTRGMNLLSWSALKRGAAKQGVRLKMVERDDWSLDVCVVEKQGRERQIMRFNPVNGLYVLEQVEGATGSEVRERNVEGGAG